MSVETFVATAEDIKKAELFKLHGNKQPTVLLTADEVNKLMIQKTRELFEKETRCKGLDKTLVKKKEEIVKAGQDLERLRLSVKEEKVEIGVMNRRKRSLKKQVQLHETKLIEQGNFGATSLKKLKTELGNLRYKVNHFNKIWNKLGILVSTLVPKENSEQFAKGVLKLYIEHCKSRTKKIVFRRTKKRKRKDDVNGDKTKKSLGTNPAKKVKVSKEEV